MINESSSVKGVVALGVVDDLGDDAVEDDIAPATSDATPMHIDGIRGRGCKRHPPDTVWLVDEGVADDEEDEVMS